MRVFKSSALLIISPAVIINYQLTLMRSGIDKNAKQREAARLQRMSNKLQSETYRSNECNLPSPKSDANQGNNHIHMLLEMGGPKSHLKKQLQLQKTEFLKYCRNIQNPQNRSKKESKLTSFKSEQPKINKQSPNPLAQPKNVANCVSQIASQYRKEMANVQEKRAKISLHTAVAKKQLDLVEKENEILASQNRKLKSELSLLQKELMVLKDNQQRIRRKNQLQLFQRQTQVQQRDIIIAELKNNINTLIPKIDKVSQLQREINNLEAQRIKTHEQLQKCKEHNYSLAEKNTIIECNYKSLFQNYAKLQVSCQSLHRQLLITKEYLAKTQALHSSSKEESYKVNQQKLKLLEQKTSVISTLNTEIALLHRKVQQMGAVVQTRQKMIVQLQTEIERQKAARIVQQLQKPKLDSQFAQLKQKTKRLQDQNKCLIDQLSKLQKTCEQQLHEIQQNQMYIQKMEFEHQNNESQWMMSFKRQLNRIVVQKDQQVAKLENQILMKDQASGQLISSLQAAEADKLHLKQLLKNKQGQILDYVKQIKQGIQKHNILNHQKDKLLHARLELQARIQQLQQRNTQLVQQLNQTKSQNAINARAKEVELGSLREGLKHRQKNIADAEVEIYREQLKNHRLMQSKEYVSSQRINDLLKQCQHYGQLSKQLSIRNEQLLVDLAARQTENSRCRAVLQRLLPKIQFLEQQLLKLPKQGQQPPNNNQIKLIQFRQPQDAHGQLDIESRVEHMLNNSRNNFLLLKNRQQQLHQLKHALQLTIASSQKDMAQLAYNNSKLQSTINSLKLQNNDLLSKVSNFECERQKLSSIIQKKSRSSKLLKAQMLQLQQSRMQLFHQNLKNEQDKFKKQLVEIFNQKEQLRKQVESLRPYQAKTRQLQQQLLNLSQLFSDESIKVETLRVRNQRLQQQMRQQQVHIEMGQEYQLQKQKLEQQMANLKQQNQTLNDQLSRVSAELLANNARIEELVVQLEGLNMITAGLNQPINQQSKFNPKEFSSPTAVRSAINRGLWQYLLSVDQDLSQIAKLLSQLQGQRQLFINQYVHISNAVENNKSSQPHPQVQQLGQHFNRYSLLHTRINKMVRGVQKTISETCRASIKKEQANICTTR